MADNFPQIFFLSLSFLGVWSRVQSRFLGESKKEGKRNTRQMSTEQPATILSTCVTWLPTETPHAQSNQEDEGSDENHSSQLLYCHNCIIHFCMFSSLISKCRQRQSITVGNLSHPGVGVQTTPTHLGLKFTPVEFGIAFLTIIFLSFCLACTFCNNIAPFY